MMPLEIQPEMQIQQPGRRINSNSDTGKCLIWNQCGVTECIQGWTQLSGLSFTDAKPSFDFFSD